MPNDAEALLEPADPPAKHESDPDCDDPTLCETVDKRVEHIARLMATGQWRVERSQRTKLGGIWGVCDTQVKRYAAEAHRLLAFDHETREQLRMWLIADLKATLEKAKTEKSKLTGMHDYGAILGAYDRIAKYASLPLEETMLDDTGPAMRVEILGADPEPEPPPADVAAPLDGAAAAAASLKKPPIA